MKWKIKVHVTTNQLTDSITSEGQSCFAPLRGGGPASFSIEGNPIGQIRPAVSFHLNLDMSGLCEKPDLFFSDGMSMSWLI